MFSFCSHLESRGNGDAHNARLPVDRLRCVREGAGEPRFSVMCEKLEGVNEDAPVRQAGQELYHWVEADARFPFRSISARFLSVGSYHILANDLRLGWHRDYAALCSPKKDESDGT
jgi:hypothetical protein